MRVLVIHPSLQPPGGGNAVAAWALQALARRHDVTLLSWRPVELDDVNRFYGTALAPRDFRTLVVPAALRRPIDAVPLPLSLLKMHGLWGWARRVLDDFDAAIATQNEIDVGRRVVQYVHYPWHLLPRPVIDLRWYHRAVPGALPLYYRLAVALSGYRNAGSRANLTLANSTWTARRYERMYGAPARTLYPPVPGPFAPLPWDRREQAIVGVGRWAPEKRVLEMIEIVRRVRERGHRLPLHLIGTPGERRYTAAVRQAARRHADWVHLHENLDRDALLRRLGATRFGLHAMVEEHFGIAIAELVHSGCLPFVHRSGGAVEIVGDDALTFTDVDEAVARICAVLADPAGQDGLRAGLDVRRREYTVEAFCDGILRAVDEVAAERPPAGAITAARTRRSAPAAR